MTEALRGEGAYLRDRDGNRFMPEFHPMGELAPRDDVSRAISTVMARTQHPCVYLDLKHLDAEKIRKRFPGIVELLRGFDLDLATDRIPVRPGAHYYIGGAKVDLDGRTTVPGLWAAGEVTSSGLHGANRLASNSLLEGLVYGARASEDIARVLQEEGPVRLEVPPVEGDDLTQRRKDGREERKDPELREYLGSEELDLADVRNALRALMWRRVGIVREGASLSEALEQVEFWCGYALPRVFHEPAGWTLQNMLTVARLMIEAARAREESRGVHTRSDFPETDPDWVRHVAFRFCSGS